MAIGGVEIEISALGRRHLAAAMGLVLVVAVCGLAVLGRAITPSEGGQPAILTMSRWQAFALARQVRSETVQLQSDGAELQALLSGPTLDPVAAMLLAQRIKANEDASDGTVVTLAGRKALVEAARVTALAASGAETRAQAIEVCNAALEQIRRLSPSMAEERPVSRRPGAPNEVVDATSASRPVRSDA
jgi:hypothetical protein